MDKERGRLRTLLVRSASPKIPVAERALRADVETTYDQRDTVALRMRDGEFHLVWSNEDSIKYRVAGIQAGIATVQALVFEALDDTELEARLSDVWASLPAVETRPAKYRREQAS